MADQIYDKCLKFLCQLLIHMYILKATCNKSKYFSKTPKTDSSVAILKKWPTKSTYDACQYLSF